MHSLTSALDAVSGQLHASAALLPGKAPGTHSEREILVSFEKHDGKKM
jgi:hypothetical protein